MGCNRWQFQVLHRLHQQLKQLAQEKGEAKWRDLVLSCDQTKECPVYSGNKLEDSKVMSKKKKINQKSKQ